MDPLHVQLQLLLTGVLSTREADGQQDTGKANTSGQELAVVTVFTISSLWGSRLGAFVLQIKLIKDLMGSLMGLLLFQR